MIVRRWPALLLLLLPFVAGCGDSDLWARWRAERALWDAHRQADRVLLRPGGPAREDWALLEARFQTVLDQFPAERWVPLAGSMGPARDVAAASGDAALVLGELSARQGRDEQAVERWKRVVQQYAPLPDVVLEARRAEAQALARLGRHDEKLVVLRAVVDSTPLVDTRTRQLRTVVLATTRQLARELQDMGREADAAELLRGAEQRFSAAFGRPGTPDRSALAVALSDVRAALADVPGSLAALRAAVDLAGESQKSIRVLSLADQALTIGAPDSVFAYARWAVTLNSSRQILAPAMLLLARAFEARGPIYSSLAAFVVLFARFPAVGSHDADGRFRRGRLVEKSGRWELARGEFRTLAASLPTHPLAFQGLRRVVQHHLDRGEFDLARVEGDATLGNLSRLLLNNRDPLVQREARGVSAEILLALGRMAMAESSLVDLWQRFPGDSATEDAALRSARIAKHLPGGAGRARELFDELRRTAGNATVRQAADAAFTESEAPRP